jgi:hypothetical protein
MIKKFVYLEAREIYIIDQLKAKFPCRLTYLGFMKVKKVKGKFIIGQVEYICEDDERGSILNDVKVQIDKEKFIRYLWRQYGN